MPKKIDITGKKYNRLTVLSEAGRDRFGQVLWDCRCDCGKRVIVRGRDLREGRTKSCGCLNIENATATIRKRTVNHSNPEVIRSKKISKMNTSGVRGVCPTKRGYWRAYIGYKGKHIYLGEYANKSDAIKARKRGEERYFSEVLRECEIQEAVCV